MRFSLAKLLSVVALSAFAIWICVPGPCPIRTLENIGAEMRYENQNVAEIMANIDGRPPPTITKPEQVCEIRFSASSPPTTKEMKMLASFPNLNEVDFPCEIAPDDLNYLSDCKNLRAVSFAGSPMGDEVLQKMMEIPSIRLVVMPDSNVHIFWSRLRENSALPRAVEVLHSQ